MLTQFATSLFEELALAPTPEPIGCGVGTKTTIVVIAPQSPQHLAVLLDQMAPCVAIAEHNGNNTSKVVLRSSPSPLLGDAVAKEVDGAVYVGTADGAVALSTDASHDITVSATPIHRPTPDQRVSVSLASAGTQISTLKQSRKASPLATKPVYVETTHCATLLSQHPSSASFCVISSCAMTIAGLHERLAPPRLNLKTSGVELVERVTPIHDAICAQGPLEGVLGPVVADANDVFRAIEWASGERRFFTLLPETFVKLCLRDYVIAPDGTTPRAFLHTNIALANVHRVCENAWRLPGSQSGAEAASALLSLSSGVAQPLFTLHIGVTDSTDSLTGLGVRWSTENLASELLLVPI